MNGLGIKSIITKKFRITTKFKDSDDKVNVLNKDFSTTYINQKWAKDITCIRTSIFRWTYLCRVIDLYSKAIIGY